MKNVPVGVSTVAGFGTAGGAYALAIADYVSGDRSQETYAALTVGTISLVTTLAGRFWQAVKPASYVKGVLGDVATGVQFGPIESGSGTQTNAVGSSTSPTSEDAAATREPGDPDALPELTTALNVPPDGDDQVVGRAYKESR